MHKLIILHTNDIHSHFEQMPKIAAGIRDRKNGWKDDEVLVIDCGDHMDRARVETEGTEGIANVAVMNETGYEYAVLGNNEGLTFLPSTLKETYSKARFAVIGSNIRENETGGVPSWMRPFQIVQKGSLRIGLIGLTVPYTNYYHLLGWDVLAPLETTKELVQQLRPIVDVIVVISHLGLSVDEQLAQEVPGIDVILGGHTHHLLERPLRINDTYVCGTGKFGQYIGEVQIDIDPVSKEIMNVDGRCFLTDSFEENTEVAYLIHAYHLQSKARLSQVVAELDEPLPMEWYGETTLGNMVAAGLRKWTEAEIGLVNAGQLLNGLQRGRITEEHLLYLCPSPVNPCSMLLKGEHIWHALEEALLDNVQRKEIRGFGFRGKRLGTLCLDGLQVEYDAGREDYHKINRIIVDTDRERLDLRKDYRIGTIDMFSFGIGYSSIREGRDVRYYLPEFLRDILKNELQDTSAIRKGQERHWIAINRLG